MQQAAVQDHGNGNIEMSLREHLIAAGAGQPLPPLPPNIAPNHAIDPAIAGVPYQIPQPEVQDTDMSEGRAKGRRELSTSKRAAQNRAAQRAFRQRKEEHIKDLKGQVKEYQQLIEVYKTLQTENYQLRDYIISLQSRLLEIQGEVPPAPAGVDLNRPLGDPSGLGLPQPSSQSQQQSEQQSGSQGSPSSSNNGGLSERQIGELQMAAQAAAAAQHGSAGNAGDFGGKTAKVDGSPPSFHNLPA